MKNKDITLRFRSVNKDIFFAIKEGRKKIETRAATEKYRKIEVDDTLKFTCGKMSFKKKAKKITHFSSVRALLKNYAPNEINPNARSENELRRMYYTYPEYKEKIRKYGIVAWELK
jgi:ASC-1-like (ASCH) protein